MSAPNEGILTKRIKIILIILSSLIIVFTFIHVYLSWTRGSNLNHVSGAWTTLALDMTEGIFYRPLFSEEIGYGGTRFFPLYFSLHALIILIIDDPVISGCILTLTVSLILLSGIFFLLKKSRIETWIAALFTAFAVAGFSMQFGMTSIRGDLLPIALNIWGVIFCTDIKKIRPFIASIFFTLAFSAKITSVYGVFAVSVWLFLNSHTKSAFKLCVFTGLGILIVIAVMYFGSSGRVFNIMSLCSSGGASLMSIVRGPLKLFYHLTKNDIPLFCLFCFALFRFFTIPKEKRISLPVVYWLSSIWITIFIFGSPGTVSNHLVDLHIASVFILASDFTGKKMNYNMQTAIFALIAFILITPTVRGFFSSSNLSHRKQIEDIISFIASQDKSEKPILSENPFIPVLAEEKIYLQDAFMFRLMKINDVSLAAPLYKKIEETGFKAIVFLNNPVKPEWHPQWYEIAHFGEGFIEAVQKRYIFAKNIGTYYIYLPKSHAETQRDKEKLF